MDGDIGLDAHASSCRLGVMTPSGKRVGSHVVETNARCLIEGVRRIPQPRHICLEEGTLSEWPYEVLSPHAEKVGVAAVSESRGVKDDRRDALGLAEGLRLGAIKRKVYKERGGFAALGYRAKDYQWIRRDGVRVKNRLKSQAKKAMLTEVKRTSGLNRNFNHTLKAIFRGAASTVIG